jgi:putative ABC transport system permease protein
MQRTSGFWKAEFIPPVLGRYFAESDEQLNAPHVVVLSTALWKNRFNGDPAIVGKTITLNSAPSTVIGIAPPDYIVFPPAEMIWIPLVLPPDRWNDHGDHELNVAGLVKAGVTPEQALRELTMIDTRLAKEYPNKGFDGTVLGQSPAEQLIGNQRRNLYTLLGAVALVLLIACGNVANLLLARGTVRRPEIAIRGALGASRRRIVGQLLIESLLLGIGGGILGLAVAAAGVKFLVRSPAGIPRLQDTTLNAPVLLFTLGLSIACALVFGLWPALRASRLDLQQTLRDGGRESAASVRDRARGALVVSELCLAQLLLVGAGLMIRSMLVVLSVPPGFATKNILMMNVQLPSARYANPAVREAAFTRIRESVAAVPGVRSAGFASMAPIHSRQFNCGAFREGSNGHDEGNWNANVRTADPGYFDVMGIPLLRGRAFTSADNAGSANVAIINRSLAVKLYGNADPIGRRVANCIGGSPEQPVWREIVGVVGDIHANGLSNDTPNEVYTPTTAVQPEPTHIGRPKQHQRAVAVAVDSASRRSDRSASPARPGDDDGGSDRTQSRAPALQYVAAHTAWRDRADPGGRRYLWSDLLLRHAAHSRVGCAHGARCIHGEREVDDRAAGVGTRHARRRARQRGVVWHHAPDAESGVRRYGARSADVCARRGHPCRHGRRRELFAGAARDADRSARGPSRLVAPARRRQYDMEFSA